MARSKAKKTETSSARQTLVVDNGAHEIKCGFASSVGVPDLARDCVTIPNCIARSQRDKRTYVGAELYDCADYGELAYRRPVEKGFVTNWEGEKAIWQTTFLLPSSVLHCDPRHTNLILTEAPNAPVALQRNADEMVFEEFEFASYLRLPGKIISLCGGPLSEHHGLTVLTAPVLNAYCAPSELVVEDQLSVSQAAECLLVIDAGHSSTTVTPLLKGRPLHSACRRLDISGKTLTNYLKELISRTFDIRKEDWIATQIKEDVCYVTDSFSRELESVWRGGLNDRRSIDTTVAVDYVLPDYETIKRGFFRVHDPVVNLRSRALGSVGASREHVVTIANERFVVPELLFTPGDIGMQQDGISGTVVQVLNALPRGLWQALLANVLVVGGTSKLPGFVERLQADLKRLMPEEYFVRVVRASDPVKNAWLGGAHLANDETVFNGLSVSRLDYMEHGDSWARRKFAGKLLP